MRYYFYLDLSCGECNVISLYYPGCSPNGYICLVWCVCDSVCELFLGVVVILLFNVMEVLRVDGGDRLDIPCMVFQ